MLGGPLRVTCSNTLVLTTTDVVAALSLDTAPPSGAVGGNACTSSAFPGLDASVPTGMSRCTGGLVSTAGSVAFRKGALTEVNVDGLVASPEAKATKLRVRMSVGEPMTSGTSCQNENRFASMVSGVMAVVGPSGEVSTPEVLTCKGNYSDHVITLPSASRLGLTFHIEGVLPVPFMSPAPAAPPVVIDTLELL